jgi:AraC family transcriptional regulator of adaptative response/methylated-DNA-[protein]-cysteine methyltransferase
MKTENKTDFRLIADAITFYLEQRNSLFTDQMALEKLEEQPEITRARIKKWANTTPEKLVAYLDPSYIKRAIAKTTNDIKNNQANVPDVHIENMLPSEIEDDGKNLSINYYFWNTLFGRIIMASTTKGVCFLAFSDEENNEAFNKLKQRFPNATYTEAEDEYQRSALSVFGNNTGDASHVQLHVKGTPFQIQVWNKLLKIPLGGLMSYSSLTDDRKFSHALGAAVGANPIAYVVPCHRVVRATGVFGEYHWGSHRKAALISWEAARLNLK